MLGQIQKALSGGFTAQQVLDYLLKSNPKYAEKIKKAMATGFTAEQVVSFLTGKKGPTEEKRRSNIQTEHAQTLEKDIQQRESMDQKGKSAALMAGGALLAPVAAGALSRALPSTLKQLAPALTQTTLGQTPQQENQSSSPPITSVSDSIPQPTNAVQQNINPEEYLGKLGVLDKVKTMLKAGNTPEGVMALLTSEGGTKRGKTDPELLANIDAYEKKSREMPKMAENQTSIGQEMAEIQGNQVVPNLGSMGKAITGNLYSGLFDALQKGKTKFAGIEDPLLKKAKPLFDAGKIKSPEDLQKFANESKASSSIGNIVMYPGGIGELLAERNGQSIVEVDGKKHKVSSGELISSPLPEKDMADLYEDVLRGIESETGEQVSRSVNVAAYDPESNSLAFIPHSGALYIYDDLSDEDRDIVMNALKTRKTTGANHIGGWQEGTKSPMGAQMSQLIRKLQAERGGKGSEYSRKYDMVYRALGAAEESHKEKYKKKKKPK